MVSISIPFHAIIGETMITTYEKKDDNTLTVTRIVSETYITDENRAEIQTEIDHMELDKAKIQIEIELLKAKIAILGGVVVLDK